MVQALLTRGTAVNANVHDGVTAFLRRMVHVWVQVSSGAAWHGLCSLFLHTSCWERWQ